MRAGTNCYRVITENCVKGACCLLYDRRLGMTFKILQPAMNLIIEQTFGKEEKEIKALFSCQI